MTELHHTEANEDPASFWQGGEADAKVEPASKQAVSGTITISLGAPPDKQDGD